MKVYIQHTGSGLYLKNVEEWVKEEDQAQCFNSTMPAIDFCIANKIQTVLILMRFGDPCYDIELRPFVSREPHPAESD